MEKLKALFVTEKWCDADPNKGLTNNYHNLFKTFKNVLTEATFNIVHLDEYALTQKKHIDTFLPSLIDKLEPTVVIFSNFIVICELLSLIQIRNWKFV